MSRLGKVFWILFLLAFFSLMGARLVIGQWHNMMWIPFAAAILSSLAAVMKDLWFYKEIFFMRTTKHGMNMGVTVLLVLATLMGVNFIAFRHNFKKDVTSDKINSLSEQTIKMLKAMTDEVNVYAFYLDNSPEQAQAKARFEQLSKMFSDENPKFIVQMVNPNRRPDLVEKYKVNVSGEVILEYKGKQTRVRDGQEQELTNAMVKITREKNKIIYAVIGHGEKDLDHAEATGASGFKKALEDASYEVRGLSLVEKNVVPEDADIVMILGPSLPYLSPEIEAIKNYLKRGGKLFLAADPGQKHNMAQFYEMMGMQFTNRFVVDPVGQLVGASAAMAIGLVYSPNSEITKAFGKNMMTGFPLAGALKKATDTLPGLQIEEIVKSSPASFTQIELSKQVKFNDKTDEKGPLTLAATVSGKAGEGKDADKEYHAVLFGDSDFVTNQVLDMQLNRDLALNSIAFLAKDRDLISIRPKKSKNTPLLMTDTQRNLFLFGFEAPISLALFVIGGVIWFRRRGA